MRHMPRKILTNAVSLGTAAALSFGMPNAVMAESIPQQLNMPGPARPEKYYSVD